MNDRNEYERLVQNPYKSIKELYHKLLTSKREAKKEELEYSLRCVCNILKHKGLDVQEYEERLFGIIKETKTENQLMVMFRELITESDNF